MIASPSTEQDERAERQKIGVDRPGQFGGAGAEIARERRKRDVDHRAVDEGDARAEDRSSECRARVLVAAWENGRRDPGVAGPGDRAAHAAVARTPDSARSCCRRIQPPIRSGSTPSSPRTKAATSSPGGTLRSTTGRTPIDLNVPPRPGRGP